MTRYIASVYFSTNLVATIHLPMTQYALSDIYAAIAAYAPHGEYSDGENITVYPRYSRASLAQRGWQPGDSIKINGCTYTYIEVGDWRLSD